METTVVLREMAVEMASKMHNRNPDWHRWMCTWAALKATVDLTEPPAETVAVVEVLIRWEEGR